MAEEEFLSKSHNRLLNIATWAKYIAWIVLIVYMLYTIGELISAQSSHDYLSASVGIQTEFKDKLKSDPLYTVSLLVSMASTFLKGIVYFLVLKGISLGLNMIVETDINYREDKKLEVGNE